MIDFHGQGAKLVADVVKLGFAVIVLVVSVVRYRAARRERLARAAAANDAGLAAIEASSSIYVRFIAVGTVFVSAMLVGPVIWAALHSRDGHVFSPPIILWIVGVLAVWFTIVVRRARQLKNKAADGSARLP